MPVVKADAYGHGAVLIAGELNRLGIHAFCVATAGEGAELREYGIQGDILILGYTPPEDTALLVRYDLIQTIVDYQYAQALDKLGLPFRYMWALTPACTGWGSAVKSRTAFAPYSR